MPKPEWKWVEKSPMQDGSGTVEVLGHPFRIVVQDLISTSHRVAFRDEVEVSRAGNFPTLMMRLVALVKEEKKP